MKASAVPSPQARRKILIAKEKPPVALGKRAVMSPVVRNRRVTM
jgi:hypothetical protein